MGMPYKKWVLWNVPSDYILVLSNLTILERQNKKKLILHVYFNAIIQFTISAWKICHSCIIFFTLFLILRIDAEKSCLTLNKQHVF